MVQAAQVVVSSRSSSFAVAAVADTAQRLALHIVSC
jgi:hypothetical protein